MLSKYGAAPINGATVVATKLYEAADMVFNVLGALVVIYLFLVMVVFSLSFIVQQILFVARDAPTGNGHGDINSFLCWTQHLQDPPILKFQLAKLPISSLSTNLEPSVLRLM